jgi:putative chitinase
MLSDILPQFQLTDTDDVCNFIAQVGHESAQFNVLSENLNYSADGLLKTFRNYFVTAPAAAYARNPEKIANLVYANRMGNGDEASGDGWKYRGKGLIQLTGKTNYENCSKSLFGDTRLLDSPEDLTKPEMALKSALWFWTSNKLTSVKDFTALTKRINGGTNGLEDREAIRQRAKLVLS